jgi:hypothetical protein
LEELAAALIDGRTERKLITANEFSFPFSEDRYETGKGDIQSICFASFPV